LRILVVIDEFTRECLAIEVARSFTARDVIMTRNQLLLPASERERSAARDLGPFMTTDFIASPLPRFVLPATLSAEHGAARPLRLGVHHSG